MSRRTSWVGPASGIVAAGLFVASGALGGWQILAVGDGLRPESPAADLTAMLAEHAETLRTGAHLGLLSALLFLVFVAYLRRHLDAHEPAGGWWSLVAFGGGIVYVGVMILQSSLALAARVVGREGLDVDIARSLMAMQWSNLDLIAPALAAVVLGASVVSVRTGALPRALGWIGLGVTGLLVAYLAVPFDTPLWMSVGLAWLWVLAAAVALLVASLRAPASASPVA